MEHKLIHHNREVAVGELGKLSGVAKDALVDSTSGAAGVL